MYLAALSYFTNLQIPERRALRFRDSPTKLPFGTTLHDNTMIQLSLLRKMFKLWNTSGVLGHLLLFRLLGGPESCFFLRLTPSAMVNASAERSQPPSLAPSTAPFQLIWWRKSGSSETPGESCIKWSASHKTNQWNPIDFIYQTAMWKFERVLLVSIQPSRISLSDSSGSDFCRKSSSIPSMKLPSFENAAREGNFFW